MKGAVKAIHARFRGAYVVTLWLLLAFCTRVPIFSGDVMNEPIRIFTALNKAGQFLVLFNDFAQEDLHFRQQGGIFRVRIIC